MEEKNEEKNTTLAKPKGKKETQKKTSTPTHRRDRYADELNAMGEYLNFRDFVLRYFAGGGRLAWTDNGPIKGLASHLGLKRSKKEYNKRIWLIASNAMHPERAAEELRLLYAQEAAPWIEDLEEVIPIDEAFNEMMDVLQSHDKPSSMLAELREMHSRGSEYEQAQEEYYKQEAFYDAYHMSEEEYALREEMLQEQYETDASIYTERERYFDDLRAEESEQINNIDNGRSEKTGDNSVDERVPERQGQRTNPQGSNEVLSETQPNSENGDRQRADARTEVGVNEESSDNLSAQSADRRSRANGQSAAIVETRSKGGVLYNAVANHIQDWADKLGVQIEIVERFEDLTNNEAIAQVQLGSYMPGFYETNTGKVVLYMPHLISRAYDPIKEVDNTIIHEVVAHKGLRKMLGEKQYKKLCERVFDAASLAVQERFMNYPGVNGRKHAAGDEMIAHFAENKELTEEERTLWQKIVDFVRNLLGIAPTNEDLERLIRQSYTELMNNGSQANEPTADEGNRYKVYRSRDGKETRFTQLSLQFGGDTAINDGSGTANVQREGDAALTTLNTLRKLEEGEVCNVERIFTESKEFNFTRGEKIESADDVAYIFKSLEDEAIENAFAALVKDGEVTVMHLGMGGQVSTLIDATAAITAANRIKPEKVYFIHNHPSGNLQCSRPDMEALGNLGKALGDIVQEGIIINTRSGKYGTFNHKDGNIDTLDIPANQDSFPLKVYKFNKQAFKNDITKVTPSSEGIAEFVSTQRLGSRNKINALLLNNLFECVGNVFLTETEITSANADRVARKLIADATAMGARGIVLYGRSPMVTVNGIGSSIVLSDKVAQMSDKNVQLFDVIQIDDNVRRSAADYGVRFRTTIAPDVREEMESIKADAIANGTFLKAPNGKDTNLNEEQWLMVRTNNFKKWFGDWDLANLYNRAVEAWNNKNSKGKVIVGLSERAKNRFNELLGTDTQQLIITDDAIRHIKKRHGENQELQGQKDMTPEDIVVIPYLVNNFDSMELNPLFDDNRGNRAIEIRKRINGVSIIATIEKGENKEFLVTSYQFAKSDALDASAETSGLYVRNDSDIANVKQDIENIKSAAKKSSKIVDENGEPMVVYHGTDSEFTSFEMQDGSIGRGAYFTSNWDEAAQYAMEKQGVENIDELDESKIKEVFLNVRDEKNITHSRFSRGDIEVLATSPNQIKSATDNNGEFSESNDIRFRIVNDLIAVHNLTEDKLRKVFDMGGLIMPSIAITKADMGHEGYGEISLLFDKDTIDPSDRRNKVFGGDHSEMILELLKEKGLKASEINKDTYDFYKNNPDVVEDIKNRINEKKTNSVSEDQREAVLKLLNERGMSFNFFSSLIRSAAGLEYDLENGGKKQIIDRGALRETINKKVKTDNADYNKWVDNLFEGIVEKYGIRNKTDWYTPSGNLRSWEKLYDAATPENILRYMLDQNEQGGSGGFWDSNIMGASADTYESIEEIREKGQKRLRRVDSNEYDEWATSVANRFSEISDEFLTPAQRNDFGGIIDAKIAITNAVAKDKTAKGIYKEMKAYYPNFTMDHANRVVEIVKEIQDYAIGYFEAKPQRIVPLSEVRKAIIPSNTSEDIVKELKDNGIEVATYRKGNEASRQRLIKKESNGIRFRVANENQEIFVSNAMRAVEGIKQDKATPEQWLAMITKQGGLKAGEDKWLGLSDWLKSSDAKTITKQEILDFIAENKIQIEEVKYGDANNADGFVSLKEEYDQWLREEGSDYAWGQLIERYGDDAEIAFNDLGGELVVENEERAAALLGGGNIINSTRLDYTTAGLNNNREIALVVPSVESWNKSDEVHFGDAGDGRAIAWVRFGETKVVVQDATQQRLNEIYDRLDEFEMKISTGITMEEYEERARLREERDKLQEIEPKTQKVLVIDEIQSKRHQEGREKGYANENTITEIKQQIDALLAEQEQIAKDILHKQGYIYHNEEDGQYSDELEYKAITGRIGSAEQMARQKEIDSQLYELNHKLREERGGVPDAPFDKNWHELAMKRMLRLAAEEGYDYVAWTKGEQQAERYDLGSRVDEIKVADGYDGVFTVIGRKDGGILLQEDVEGEQGLAELLGTDLARKAYSNLKEGKDDYLNEDGAVSFTGESLVIGGEGMKGFYDKMLPSFVSKYTKKWGAKVEDIELPELEESARVMHSVNITPEMKESVMQGQTMFRIGNNEQTRELNAKQAKTADARVIQKEAESDTRFSVSKNNRATINKWLDKRSDITEDERKTFFLEIDDKEPMVQLATAKWFANGAIRLPEDQLTVDEAIRNARKMNVDPVGYAAPGIINKQYRESFGEDEKDKEDLLSPDDARFEGILTNKTEYGNGIVVYDVQNDRVGQDAVRELMNDHLGKDFNCWCLLYANADGKVTESARDYWGDYDSVQKRVAFKDGKICSFCASNSGSTEWWDLSDVSHYNNIPVEMDIPNDELGRKTSYGYNEETGEFNRDEDAAIFRGNRKNGIYEEWYSEDPHSLAKRITYKGGTMHGKREGWHENGQMSFRGTYKNGMLHGHVERWHSNGQMSLVADYIYDMPEGLYQTWHSNGQQEKNSTIKNGRIEGTYELWYENGQLEQRANYKEGLIHGIFEQWYKNGNLKRKYHEKDGFIYGEYLEFYSDGTPLRKYNYNEKGGREGLQESYHPNGNIASKSFYINGKEEGAAETWNENRTSYHKVLYKNGKRHGVSETYENDILVSRTSYEEGRLHGLSEEYSKEGYLTSRKEYKYGYLNGVAESYHYDTHTIASRFNYVNGLRDGLSEIWYRNGQIQARGYFKSENIEGVSTTWYENGQIKAIEEFEDGVRAGKVMLFDRYGSFEYIETYEHGALNGESLYFEDGILTYITEFEKGRRISERRATEEDLDKYDKSIRKDLQELLSMEKNTDETGTSFRAVTDKAKLNELESGEKIEAYRAVQIDANGTLYSPMASQIKSTKGGVKVVNDAAQMNQWDEAVENVDKVDEKGRITIMDEDGGSTPVAYNPYGHCCVNSMMNDQFKRAYKRDNLYVMRVLAPASELTSGYHAEKAKDAVGIHKWKTGVVGRQLPEDKRREILLTRWMKNVEVMSWEDVAQDWVKTLKGENISVPFNVIPRKILNMLSEAGIDIVAPEKGMENARGAYEQWLANPIEYVGDTNLPAQVKELNEQTRFRTQWQEPPMKVMELLEGMTGKTREQLIEEYAPKEVIRDRTDFPENRHEGESAEAFYNRVMEYYNNHYNVITNTAMVNLEVADVTDRLKDSFGMSEEDARALVERYKNKKTLGVFNNKYNAAIIFVRPDASSAYEVLETIFHESLHAFLYEYLNNLPKDDSVLYEYGIFVNDIINRLRVEVDYLARTDELAKERIAFLDKEAGSKEEYITYTIANGMANNNVMKWISALSHSQQELFNDFFDRIGYDTEWQTSDRKVSNERGSATHPGWNDRRETYSAKRDHARAISERLGVEIEIVAKADMPKGHEESMGVWRNGKIFICPANIPNADEAERTVLHEAVGHEGLRKLVGAENMTNFCMDLYRRLPKNRRAIIELSRNKHGWNIEEAVEEYLAEKAQDFNLDSEETRNLWDVIVEALRGLLSKIGINVPLSERDVRWLVYQSAKALDHNFMTELARATLAHKLGFSLRAQAVRAEAQDIIRDRQVEEDTRFSAARDYNRAVSQWSSRLRETYVDMHDSVSRLMEAIEDATGKEAEKFEDVRIALNQMSSKGLAEMEQWERKYWDPIKDIIRKIVNETGQSVDDIQRYMMLKHALERNEKLAARDAKRQRKQEFENEKTRINNDASLTDAQKQAQIAAADATLQAQLIDIDNKVDAVYKDNREKDYGGLTGMYTDYGQVGVYDKTIESLEEYQQRLHNARRKKYKTVAAMEKAAIAEVAAYENAIGTNNITELWKRINAATKATLHKQYTSNMISRSQYEQVRDMFEYYVPLRGFAENTAEDLFDYYSRAEATNYSKPMLSAGGRESMADSPLGYIGSMASSAIAEGVKNEAKLTLYYFASNRAGNDLITMSDTWYEYIFDNNGKKIGVTPVYPPFTEELSTDAAKQAYEQWENDMKQKQAAGLAVKGARKARKMGLDYVIQQSKNQAQSHIIKVRVLGEEKFLFINGNPRAAQAINNELNVEVADDYQKYFGKALRFLSGVNTQYNPEFWISNFQRDILFALMSVDIKEDSAYNRAYRQNLIKAIKVFKMKKDYESGKVPTSAEEAYYKEYVDNGGVTGYTYIKGNEEWEAQIRKLGLSSKEENILTTTFKGIEHIGNSIEQISRFAAYMTSRQMGRDVRTSISNAKELTVNFNRKGSGKTISWEETDKLRKKNGKKLNNFERALVMILSWISAGGRRLFMFFNAAIQGLNASYQLAKANKAKAAKWAGMYFALGAMQAAVHGLIDDDDEEGQYLDRPDYERRNNALIGVNGHYFKWALPQEMRFFYGLGDIIYNHIAGRSPHKNILGEIGMSMLDVLPINPAAGISAVVPSVVSPLVEVMINEDFKGAKIYNDMPWLSDEEKKRMPEYQKAFRSTGSLYVNISKLLNDISGGDETTSGFLDGIITNPAVVEHVIEGYLGGALTTASRLYRSTIGQLFGEELNVSNIPFLNRVWVVSDDRSRNAYVNEVYDYYKAEAEHTDTRISKYEKMKDTESLKEIKESYDYEVLKIYEKYEKKIKTYNDMLKKTEDYDERKQLMREQDAIKRKMIKEISELK